MNDGTIRDRSKNPLGLVGNHPGKRNGAFNVVPSNHLRQKHYNGAISNFLRSFSGKKLVFYFEKKKEVRFIPKKSPVGSKIFKPEVFYNYYSIEFRAALHLSPIEVPEFLLLQSNHGTVR